MSVTVNYYFTKNDQPVQKDTQEVVTSHISAFRQSVGSNMWLVPDYWNNAHDFQFLQSCTAPHPLCGSGPNPHSPRWRSICFNEIVHPPHVSKNVFDSRINGLIERVLPVRYPVHIIHPWSAVIVFVQSNRAFDAPDKTFQLTRHARQRSFRVIGKCGNNCV